MAIAEGYKEINPFDIAQAVPCWRPPVVGEGWRCPICSTSRLQAVRSDQYQTSLRCPDCKIQFVIHDGQA